MTFPTIIDPDQHLSMLWVDADGALLVASDDSSDPLPVGARRTRILLVNDDGEIVVSAS